MKTVKKWYFKCKSIKCDADGCGWRNDSITEDTIEDWCNQPCPKCGANLLTDHDWKLMVCINKILGSWPMRLFTWVGEKLGAKKSTYKMTTNGIGKISFEEVNTN